MYETPEQYADRVLNYVLKARKPLDLHDPNLQPLSKAKKHQDSFDLAVNKKYTEIDGYERTTPHKLVKKATPKTNDFDLAVEQHFQKGFPEFVKAKKPEPAPKDQFDAAVKKKLDSL